MRPEIIHVSWFNIFLFNIKQVLCYKLECDDHSATWHFYIPTDYFNESSQLVTKDVISATYLMKNKRFIDKNPNIQLHMKEFVVILA